MTAIEAIHRIGRLVFTTREIATLISSSVASTTQVLKRLEDQRVIKKVMHGVWAFVYEARFSPFLLIPYLAQNHRSYLSFISALHAHGVISQIPQVITVASTAHARVIKTPVGVFDIHQISPDMFAGFNWHGDSDYLIAVPEKALVDCLYLASRKGKRFKNFPEMDVEKLDMHLIQKWVDRIKDKRIHVAVEGDVERIMG